MTTLARPYPGQGLSVPREDGIEGEWVFQGQVFIFSKPTGINILSKHFSNGEKGIGFSLDALAKVMKKTAEQILAFNREQTLAVRWEKAPTAAGADLTEFFVFTTPDGFELKAPVNMAAIRGSA
jgi:hypothetical protein